jgi:hypothetical protein
MTDAGNPFAPAPAQIPAPVEPYVHSPQPPLSIAHLLVWTAGSAVILGVAQTYARWADFPEWFRIPYQVQEVLYSPLAGAAICSLYLAAYRLLTHGPAFPVQPGHWLLLVYGLRTAFSWCGAGAVLVLDHFMIRVLGPYQGMLSVVAFCGAGAVGYGIACWRLRDRPSWRIYLLVLALLDLLVAGAWLIMLVGPLFGRDSFQQGLVSLAQAVQVVGGVLLGLVLFVLAVIELARGIRRDWLHWLGVVLSLLVSLFNVAMQVIFAIAAQSHS